MTAKKYPSNVKTPVKTAAKPTMAKPGMVIVKKVMKGAPIIQKSTAVKTIAKPTVAAKAVSKPVAKKVAAKPAVKSVVKVQPKKPVISKASVAKLMVKREVKKPTDIKPPVKPTPVVKADIGKVTLNSLLPNIPKKPVDPAKVVGKISFKDLMTNMTASLATGDVPGQAR